MINHCGSKEIKTERLLLRAFRAEDAEIIFSKWTSDARVAEYTTWYAHSSVEDTKGYVNYILSMDKNTSYNWVVEAGGSAIGAINVCYSDERLELAGLAYVFSYESWGKGYATEAARAVSQFLFGIGYRKIIAGCDEKNKGSVRVLEKIGMKQEGCFRKQILRKDGSYGDDLQFGLFRDELCTGNEVL